MLQPSSRNAFGIFSTSSSKFGALLFPRKFDRTSLKAFQAASFCLSRDEANHEFVDLRTDKHACLNLGCCHARVLLLYVAEQLFLHTSLLPSSPSFIRMLTLGRSS